MKDRELRDLVEKKLMDDLRNKELECTNHILHINALEQVGLTFRRRLCNGCLHYLSGTKQYYASVAKLWLVSSKANATSPWWSTPARNARGRAPSVTL